MMVALRGYGRARLASNATPAAANSRAGRRNIADHYDLGSGFYRLWLDPTMTYSSAIFAEAHQGLSDGRLAKNRRMAEPD
jgi:cyclopropane-fatty-acyl-phospholipid synthase